MMPSKPILAVAAVLGLGILFSDLVSQGQPTAGGDDAAIASLDVQVKRFLDAVAAGDTDGALRDLLTDSNLNPQAEDVRMLAAKAASLETKYGPFRGMERIDASRVASDLVVMKYLYKCERFPVVWYFTFYRGSAAGANSGAWSIITVRFDTELELLAL